MAHIVFWSDDNFKKFMEPFEKANFTSDFELFLNMPNTHKNFKIVKSKENIINGVKRTNAWRWEMANAVSTIVDTDDDFIEGIPIPDKYRDRVRWKLMFPVDDIPALIRVLSNTKYFKRRVNHYLYEKGEIKLIGRLELDHGKITSDGIYSDDPSLFFSEKKAMSDYNDDIGYWSEEKIIYDVYLKGAKQLFDIEYAKFESGKYNIALLLKNLPESYVTIETS
jgi:hypothetical protein